MNKEIEVHARINKRHPEISKDDVVAAWNNRLRTQRRDSMEVDHYVAVGLDSKGRLLEMVAASGANEMLIFHASKATEKTLVELGMTDRRGHGFHS